MSTSQSHVPLPGSERAPLPGAKVVGPTNPNEQIEVTVLLRPRTSGAAAAAALTAKLPHERQYLSRSDLADATGADPNDIAAVEAFAQAHGLDVVETSIARRSVVLAGTLAAMSAAFAVTLQQYAHPSGT